MGLLKSVFVTSPRVLYRRVKMFDPMPKLSTLASMSFKDAFTGFWPAPQT